MFSTWLVYFLQLKFYISYRQATDYLQDSLNKLLWGTKHYLQLLCYANLKTELLA